MGEVDTSAVYRRAAWTQATVHTCIQFNLPRIHVFGRWEQVKRTPQRTHADEGMNMQTPQREAQARLRTLNLLAVRRRCRPLHHLLKITSVFMS